MAVTFDAVGPSSSGFAQTGWTSPVTWSHTVGASATALFVWVAIDNTLSATTTCKVGSTAMTAFGANPIDNNGSYCYGFSLLNPPTGTQTITVTTAASSSGYLTGGSISFDGAGSLGFPVAITNQTSTSLSLDPGGVASTSMVVAFGGFGDSPAGDLTTGTSRFTAVGAGSSGGPNGNSACGTNVGSGAVAVTWSGLPSGDTNCGWCIEVIASSSTVVTPKPVVKTTTKRPKSQTFFRKAPPVFTAPTQKPVVKTVVRRNKGLIFFRKAPPVFTAPTQKPVVITFRRRNKGQLIVLRPPPAQPVSQRPIIKTVVRRNKGGVWYRPTPPVFTAPTQKPVIKMVVRRNKGQVHVQPLPPPPIVATYPPIIKTIVRRNKGQVKLFSFPPVFTAPTQKPIIKGFIRRNKGQVHTQTFPPPFIVPTQRPIIKTITRRNKGQVHVSAFPPVFTAPTQRPIIKTQSLKRRSFIQILRGITAPVTPTTTTYPPIITTRRRITRAVIQILRPPRHGPRTPTEFTARPPIPYWIPAFIRLWWETGRPHTSRWEVGEANGAWSSTQAVLEPLEATVGSPFGSGLFGMGLFGEGIPQPTGNAADVDKPTKAWKTGGPRP